MTSVDYSGQDINIKGGVPESGMSTCERPETAVTHHSVLFQYPGNDRGLYTLYDGRIEQYNMAHVKCHSEYTIDST